MKLFLLLFCCLKGHPFMESITQNRPFFYSMVFSGTAVVIITLGLMPELNDQFEIVSIPPEVFLFHNSIWHVLYLKCFYLVDNDSLTHF